MGFRRIKPFLTIDGIYTKDGRVLLNGWALSYYADELAFSVTDRAGKTLPVDVTIQKRLDPGRLIFGDDSHPNAGFRLSFPGTKDEIYTLTVSDGVAKRKNRFLPGGYTLSWKYRPKAFFREYAKRLLEIPATIRDEGGKQFFREMRSDFRKEEYRYHVFAKAHDVTEEELLREKQEELPVKPFFSLIVPAYRTPVDFLKQMIDSVRNGSYGNFEIVIADGSYPDTSVSDALIEMEKEDPRIRHKTLEKNLGISGNTNEALKMAKGGWIVLMDHDDLLAPNALYEFAKAINAHPDAGAVYSDEDKITMDLCRRFQPAFKPDFDPVYLTSNNYICHLFGVKAEVAQEVGLFEPACDGAQDQDYILRVTERTKTVHIPKVLYHWRTHPNSTAADAESKMYCYEAGALSVNRYYERNAIEARAFVSEFYGHYDTYFEVEEEDLISVIMFGKGEKADEARTASSIRNASPYGNYEFLSGAESIEKATGKYLLFIRKGSVLEGKSRVFGDGVWYSFPYNMIGRLSSDAVGAVGGKVVDKNRKITYAGAVKNRNHLVDPVLRGEDENVTALNGRALDAKIVPSVSAECVMMKRDVFLSAGGFDRSLLHYPMADLAFRLAKGGRILIYEPLVTVAAPFENGERQTFLYGKKESRELVKKYADLLKDDPTSNVNTMVHFEKLTLKE